MLRREAVVDAAQFAEQAKTEETTRTATLRTSQVSANEVCEDTHKNISELEESIVAFELSVTKGGKEGKSWNGRLDQMKKCIATIADHALDEGGYHKFLVNEKLWGKYVAETSRFAEQAKNERNYEEMNRMAELRT